jgi:hypothetical protein
MVCGPQATVGAANACAGVSPLLLGMQQSLVPQGGPAATDNGLRVPHLHLRRARREQVRLPERSPHCHKVRFLICLPAYARALTLRREQVGVTTDLGTDPTLARLFRTLRPLSSN